jgi:hypothetical protein
MPPGVAGAGGVAIAPPEVLGHRSRESGGQSRSTSDPSRPADCLPANLPPDAPVDSTDGHGSGDARPHLLSVGRGLLRSR